MYSAVTRGIRVTVTPRYLEGESHPDAGRYFFAYTVEITNLTMKRTQLLTRTWRIIDALGRVQEVHGDGVVGKQPVLGPGETFTYTSGCPLETPSGTMQGSYSMQADGEDFDVAIPAFSLDSPDAKRSVH